MASAGKNSHRQAETMIYSTQEKKYLVVNPSHSLKFTIIHTKPTSPVPGHFVRPTEVRLVIFWQNNSIKSSLGQVNIKSKKSTELES